jgi:hypothetical protein
MGIQHDFNINVMELSAGNNGYLTDHSCGYDHFHLGIFCNHHGMLWDINPWGISIAISGSPERIWMGKSTRGLANNIWNINQMTKNRAGKCDKCPLLSLV